MVTLPHAREFHESLRGLCLLMVVAMLASCSTSAVVENRKAAAKESPTISRPQGAKPVLASANGCAVYYSRSHHGKRTADGGRLDNNKLTAAHTTYPFGTVVRVTRVRNGKSVEVRITDHLPSTKLHRRHSIIIDLTRAAASKLDMIKDGRAKVKVEVLEWGTRKQR